MADLAMVALASSACLLYSGPAAEVTRITAVTSRGPILEPIIACKLGPATSPLRPLSGCSAHHSSPSRQTVSHRRP